MSHRGDEDGFHPHPGDPWHPGWTSEGEPEPEAPPVAPPVPSALPTPAGAPAGEEPSAGEGRRRFGRGRRREHRAEAAGEPPAPEQVEEPSLPEAGPSGWWASGAPVDETAWAERAPAPPAPETDVLEDEVAAPPATPVFPWWGATAPEGAAPAAAEAPAWEAPAWEAPAETPAARREQPSAAAAVPLDLPVAPATPPSTPEAPFQPEPAAWWEVAVVSAEAPADLPSGPAAWPSVPPSAAQAEDGQAPRPAPPDIAGEGEAVPAVASEADRGPAVPAASAAEGEGPQAAPPEGAPAASSLEDELARATAALLAELGEVPTVEPLGEVTAEPTGEPLEALPWSLPGIDEERGVAPGKAHGRETARPLEPEAEEAAGTPQDLLEVRWPPATPAVEEEDRAEEEPLGGAGLVLTSWEPPAAQPAEAPGAAGEEGLFDTAAPGAPVEAAGEGGPPAGEAAGLEPADAEGEVDDWLAFVEGIPAGGLPSAGRPAAPAAAPEPEPASAPPTDWVLEGEAAPSPSVPPRRRGWFGRGRRKDRVGEEWPERTWAAEDEAAEAEAHQPPPWQAPAPEAAAPSVEAPAVPAYDGDEEAEAAWAAWETGEPGAAAAETSAAAEPGTHPPEAPVADRPSTRPAPEPEVPLAAWAPPGGEAAEPFWEEGEWAAEPGTHPPEAPVADRPSTRPAPEPEVPLAAWAPPGGEAAEPLWEEGEWAGEPEPPAGDWLAPVDEDEVEVPAAGLPEEEWEGAAEPSGAGPAVIGPAVAAEDTGEVGWELFPEPGKPLPSQAGQVIPAPAREQAAPPYPAPAWSEAPAPEPPPARPATPAPAPGIEDEGWEVFPEPGTPAPRWRGEAAPTRPAPVPGPEPVFPEDEGGAGGEWPEEQSPYAPPAGSRPTASAGLPTMEFTPPVFDFERPPRPQGPISEETLAGAVTMEHRGLAEEVAAADTAETELQALSAPMPGLESGVVGFEDVAHLSTEEEMAAPVRSDLPVRVATGMVLAALLLGSLWVGGEFLAGFVGLMVMLGLGEFYGSLRRRGYQPLSLFGFLGAIGLLAGTWFYGPVAIPVAAVATTVLTFFYYAFALRRRDALTNGGLTLLGMLWVTATAAFAFPIAAAPDFRVLILATAATVIATDVGAYFAGRAWGARLMAPVLSPHKTWEGLAGGVVLGIGAAVAAGYFFDEIGMRAGAALGLVVAVMAPLGDLAESMVKRSLDVKDMGSILPGHGGILDRIDAFLFVLPAAWVLFETMGLLR